MRTKKIKNSLEFLSCHLISLSALLVALSFSLAALLLLLTPGYILWLIPLIIIFAAVFLSLAYLFNQFVIQNEQDSENPANKDESLSFIAHELNAPLGNIKGAISLVKVEEGSKISPASRKLLGRTEESLAQLVKLIDNLLLISRYDRGRMDLLPRRASLEEIVRPVVENYQQTASEKGLGLIYNKPPEALPEVYVDPDRIREVVENLLSNSLKYTREGSVTVSLTKELKTVTLSIKDTGVGIPRESQSRLFKRFSRLKNSQSAKGTGLGLYISRLIIEAHHGKIGLVSEEGQGSTFYFSLPIAKKERK